MPKRSAYLPLRARSTGVALAAGLAALLLTGCARDVPAETDAGATQPVAAVTSDAATVAPPEHPADADGVPELVWDDLLGLDLETGMPSDDLAALDGRRVRIPGFMVPLEDTATEVGEFLLVPFVGACIHVPPPPANQMVHVLMADGATTTVYWWDPIWIYGTLHIENVEHVYGKASFRFDGDEVVRYTPGS